MKNLSKRLAYPISLESGARIALDELLEAEKRRAMTRKAEADFLAAQECDSPLIVCAVCGDECEPTIVNGVCDPCVRQHGGDIARMDDKL